MQKRQLQVEAVRILDVKWCRSITTDIMLVVQTGFPPIAAFGAKSAGKGAALSLVWCPEFTSRVAHRHRTAPKHGSPKEFPRISGRALAALVGTLQQLWQEGHGYWWPRSHLAGQHSQKMYQNVTSGYPMVIQWFSNGYPMVIPRYSDGYPMVRFDAGETWWNHTRDAMPKPAPYQPHQNKRGCFGPSGAPSMMQHSSFGVMANCSKSKCVHWAVQSGVKNLGCAGTLDSGWCFENALHQKKNVKTLHAENQIWQNFTKRTWDWHRNHGHFSVSKAEFPAC